MKGALVYILLIILLLGILELGTCTDPYNGLDTVAVEGSYQEDGI